VYNKKLKIDNRIDFITIYIELFFITLSLDELSFNM